MTNTSDVKQFMIKEMNCPSVQYDSATELVEFTAEHFQMHDVLDDETHWIWDLGMSVFMEYE